MVIRSCRVIAAMVVISAVSASAFAAKISDISNTKHNLSSSGTGNPVTSSEDQICVFCHTPHQANANAKAPLWNRALSGATYTELYTSESLDAITAAPEGSSKLCLSCHDGTVAIGKVGVLNGTAYDTSAAATPAIDMTGAGVGADDKLTTTDSTTGFTRNLGTNLTNDHPISFTYDTALSTSDGELLEPVDATHIGTGTPRHAIPLEVGADSKNKVQCTSCHDPHIRDVDLDKNAKFLRLNRFQENAAVSQGSFDSSDTGDQICLGCHDKAGWSGSAHANSAVATQTYTTDAATQRDFDAALPVWKAACLNCHDTHTVQGAKRLLREGTDSIATPKAGGNPAMEETCYQCHDGGTGAVLNSYTTVPNIKSDFALTYHMPISSVDQAAGSEVHAIGTGADATEGTQRGKDFVESPSLLGKGNLSNRHAECTDCHNPHRVIKNRAFNGNSAVPDAAGTHKHNLVAGETHTNIASGVLAGTTGVEPVYGATTWGSLPTSYNLKKGYGGKDASDVVLSGYVTREYQVCLKCHSDYAWTTAPTVGPSININGVTQYTNQAMEFQAPTSQQNGTVTNRSWHPVIDKTGRTALIRGGGTTAMDSANFLAPWNNGIGTQTMYCSDCHGSDTGAGNNTVVPVNGEDGNPWGPHGSTNNFILKGPWNTAAAGVRTADDICFKCHAWGQYADPAAVTIGRSGFSCDDGLCTTGAVNAGVNSCTFPPRYAPNLHLGHARKLGGMRCTWCHTAVPHGWKNKALLVDITNDKNADNITSTCGGLENCYANEYYQGAYLGGNATGVNWKASGKWTAGDCGGAAAGGWMAQAAGCNAPVL